VESESRFGDKASTYEALIVRLESSFSETSDPTARMATVAALLHKHFEHVFWAGFYLLASDGELVVGPYQGAPACLVLERHRGVCWSAVNSSSFVNVPNVHDFEGHIQCEGPSNSEVAVPVLGANGEVTGVLHLDSADFDAFDEIDERYLARIARMLDLPSS
jgi:L-methionine (R)-S-oxide reductase